MAVAAPEHVEELTKEEIRALRRPKRAPKRGRGCGRDAGLGRKGEPPFEELHPAWRTMRRIKQRQAKVVRKDLRAAIAAGDALATQ